MDQDTGAILLAVYDITAAGQHNILGDLISRIQIIPLLLYGLF